MKKASLLVAVMITLTGIVQAYTIEYTGTANANVPSTVNVDVKQFDPSLGTLTGVTLSLVSASQSGSLRLINGHAGNETWDVVLNSGAIRFYDGNNNNTMVVWDNDGDIFTTSYITQHTAFANSTTPVSPQAPNGSSSQAYGALANYIGTGNVASMKVQFYGSYGVAGLTGGDGFVVDSYSGAASWKVTYDYVPEPTSMALLAIGCAVLGLRRRGRNTPNA